MFFKKKSEQRNYDMTNQKPVIHSSICTGEKIAGFQDIHSNKFTEIMLIRSEADLKEFCQIYNIRQSDITTQY